MIEYQFLESVSRNTLLGIRFWDPTLDEAVRSGLMVTLHPVNNPAKKITASTTRSGVYSFHHIPGMYQLETQVNIEDIASGSPTDTLEYVLEVHDLKQRFVSVALLIELPLPYQGIFLVDDAVSSPGNNPPGFNLYSSASRNNASQFTFVRGELLVRGTTQPAAHAVVRIETEDGYSWYGIADANGRFAVMMAYPSTHMSFGSSPPVIDGVRLFQRTWDVTMNVYYEPTALIALNGSDIPDYSSVLNQSQAVIYTESPETDVGEVLDMPVELLYGRDVVVKTECFSELYISQTGSPM